MGAPPLTPRDDGLRGAGSLKDLGLSQLRKGKRVSPSSPKIIMAHRLHSWYQRSCGFIVVKLSLLSLLLAKWGICYDQMHLDCLLLTPSILVDLGGLF